MGSFDSVAGLKLLLGKAGMKSTPLSNRKRHHSIFLADEHFPCYVMPVVKLLALERFLPHETLLASGDLIKCDLTTHREKPIIFVSHQVSITVTLY